VYGEVVRTHSDIPQYCNPALNVTRVQRIVETRHGVSTHVSDFLHLRKLVGGTSDKIEERQALEILRLLQCFFDDLIHEEST
jgi:hypothetical protein